jgi:hypothetical protein
MEKTSKLIEFHSSNWLILCSANDVFNLEICAGGTQFQSNDVSKTAFTTLLLAVSPNYLLFQSNTDSRFKDQWMIFLNTITNVLHWDYVWVPYRLLSVNLYPQRV